MVIFTLMVYRIKSVLVKSLRTEHVKYKRKIVMSQQVPSCTVFE